jgi:hypothetical protein
MAYLLSNEPIRLSLRHLKKPLSEFHAAPTSRATVQSRNGTRSGCMKR